MTETLEGDDIQGLLAWGYGHLPSAAWHLVKITNRRKAAAWLAATTDLVTTAGGESPRETAVNIALTPSGLTKLGLSAEGLAGFSPEFRGGMTTEHRQRVLGDLDGRSPEHWIWGGTKTDDPDAIVLLYASTDDALAQLEEQVLGGGASIGIAPVHRLATQWLGDREHFGFRDGIAQPAVAGLRPGRPDDTIAAGEFILGYENEYGRRTDRPLLDPAADPAGLLPPAADDPSRADLGRNGSYLVVRQLGQDVPGFWRFADA
ncbi:MAG: hypothetical protein JHD16_06105, partial [Solirubrobacteraceae bacterium]|nr:hypothetical protein [Solirubrobacteraceae bacterium]